MVKKASSTIIKLGDSGRTVEAIQKLLQKCGSTVKATGVFNIGTVSAVRAFQKKHGLKVTGNVDSITHAALKEAAKPVRKSKK